jgi:cell division protein DivIC
MVKDKFQKLWFFIRNKYVLTSIIFFVWLFVFDQHNLVDRIKAHQHLNQIRQDTAYYSEKIKTDRENINLLETNKDNLEKFARERYLMKAPDEDVFIIVKK